MVGLRRALPGAALARHHGGMAQVVDRSPVIRSGDPVILPKTALAAVAATFLLIGVLAASYGPLLEHLVRRFGISLPEAGSVFSAHFAGALVGVFVSMWAMERVSGRIVVWAALGCIAIGCAGVAIAPSWPTFLVAVVVVGLGLGRLSLGLNQLWPHSHAPRRTALSKAHHRANGSGPVPRPFRIPRPTRDPTAPRAAPGSEAKRTPKTERTRANEASWTGRASRSP